MVKAFWQHHRLRRLVIVLGIIIFIFLFKLTIDYMNYSFSKTFIFENENGFSYDCMNYVKYTKLTIDDFANSEFSDEYTEIYINNEKVYIACLKNIKYRVFPSFFRMNKPPVNYSLNDALQNNLTTLEELEKYYDNTFSDFDDLYNYKTKDLIIYNNKD